MILGSEEESHPPAFLDKFFPSVYRKETQDTSTKQYCKFDSATLTLFALSLYGAALIASLAASHVMRKLGRKPSMLRGGVLSVAELSTMALLRT